jgi:RNA-directed DNA polymerase
MNSAGEAPATTQRCANSPTASSASSTAASKPARTTTSTPPGDTTTNKINKLLLDNSTHGMSDKTRIVYCQDADRRGDHEVTSFTFLGYTFRPRLAKSKHGKHFVSFLPAVSKDAIKAMGREIRSWHIARRSDKSLSDLAHMFNTIVRGWINYYGRFYKSMLYPLLRRINDHLVRWAMRKYKRLRRREKRAGELMAEASRRSPRLFAHWRFGLKPAGWTMGAV